MSKTPTITVLLPHGHSCVLATTDPYGDKCDIVAAMRMGSDGVKHYVGADSTDIYFDPSTVVGLSVYE